MKYNWLHYTAMFQKNILALGKSNIDLKCCSVMNCTVYYSEVDIYALKELFYTSKL